MRIHYVQHVPFENPGSILTWAKENGHSLSHTQLYKGEKLPGVDSFDILVIMGGPMNIYEDALYPWLTPEKLFIRQAIDHGKILIGLCLGAQLIADVIGGKVTRNPQKEIGWFPVQFRKEARLSPLFSFFPEAPMVFEWHGDTFSLLPDEALCIAENDVCRHQAFVYKNRVFGFQFHLENTESILRGLIEHCSAELTEGPCIQSAEEILSHPEYIAQDNVWMSQFLTQLTKKIEAGEI